MPALALAAHQYFGFKGGACGRCQIDLVRHVAVGGTYYCAYLRCVKAVVKIVLLQQVGCGNCNRAQFVQRQYCVPELVVAFEHQHYAVALFNAERFKVVCALIRGALHIVKGKAALNLVLINMQHCELFGGFLRYFVHNIKGEVKFILVFKLYFLQRAVFGFCTFHEL